MLGPYDSLELGIGSLAGPFCGNRFCHRSLIKSGIRHDTWQLIKNLLEIDPTLIKRRGGLILDYQANRGRPRPPIDKTRWATKRSDIVPICIWYGIIRKNVKLQIFTAGKETKM